MVPLASCGRSLTAFQTTLCLTLYLQAASALDTAHEYITALTSTAVIMGIHKQAQDLPQDQRALQRRIWSSIRTLDVYISAILGVPHSAAVDENSTQEAFPKMTQDLYHGSRPFYEAHAQLVWILGRGTCDLVTKSFHTREGALHTTSNDLAVWATTELAPLPSIEDMSK